MGAWLDFYCVCAFHSFHERIFFSQNALNTGMGVLRIFCVNFLAANARLWMGTYQLQEIA